MLNTVLDGDNHVAEGFNGSANGYSSSCRNNLDRAVSPRFEGFQKAVKCAALRLVNLSDSRLPEIPRPNRLWCLRGNAQGCPHYCIQASDARSGWLPH